MRLEYKSRTGHFNFCNPDEESVSTSIKVFGDNGDVIKHTSVSPEYEIDGNDVDEAIEMMEENNRKVLYSSSQKEWAELISFLKEHKEEIENGNKKYRIEQLNKQIMKLQDELFELTK